MAHTPGPWWVDEPDDPAADKREVSDCEGATATVYGDAATATANASLIAAAPELLAALKAHLPWRTEPVQGWGCWADAVAAIAKAEGRANDQ